MLLVKTKLGISAIEGIGLFADQFIPKGMEIWKWTEGFDIRMRAQDLERLCPPARETFLKYSYLSKRSGLYVLCFDNSRFLNHSESPNVADINSPEFEEGVDVAARDIQPGEELTCNYQAFDNEITRKLASAS